MSNDTEYCSRTNYVKVKDFEGLVKSLAPFGVYLSKHKTNGTYMMYGPYDGPFLSWASVEISENDDEINWDEVELDPNEHIIPFLEDGEVLVLTQVAHEYPLWLQGYTIAYTKGKKELIINLPDIHTQIESEWNIKDICTQY